MTQEHFLKAIEQAYRKGLKDAKGLKDINPFLLTSQIVAQELANEFFKTCDSEELCRCTGIIDIEKANDVVWCRKCRKKFLAA
jgi:hypothetical protein